MNVLLRDLGERAITEGILPSICPAVGDDCGYFSLGSSDLVITTDPVPPPAAMVLGGDPDPYWAGRLLVTINASDLAAAGAEALMFVAALECPADMELKDLTRILEGVRDGCEQAGLTYCGGNLKEARSFAATGTAVGRVPTGKRLHRKGAASGDLLFSVGTGGEFWRDVFRWRAGERFPKESSKLFAPGSQIRPMRILNELVRISSAMDNSDGLLATLDQLARVNRCEILLDLDKLSVPGTNASAVDQARLWLGWGDWNVIIAIPQNELENLRRTATDNDIPLFEIGRFAQGPAGLKLVHGGTLFQAPRLESERFSADSWFSEGIEGYISRLTSLEIM